MLDAALLPLHNARVRLRALAPDDAVAFADGSDDPAVQRYGHLPEPAYTPDSVRAMIERDVRPGMARGDLAVLAIADATTDAFAGSLVIFDVSEKRAEVGFWVHPHSRGCGVSTAALELAVGFALDSGLQELTARTLPENVSSQRVLENARFTFRGHNVGTTPSGQRTDLWEYSRWLHDE